MNVILLERIENLGQMGEVVNVKSGYARNYLLPQKKARRATEANKKFFEEQRAQLEAVNLEKRSEAESVAKQMGEISIVLIRQAGDAGQLYGSVNARDIATAMTDAGNTVARSQIRLANPIKALGVYKVQVDLHPEVAIEITANIARTPEEADIQTKTGRAVVGDDEQEALDLQEAARADEVFEEGAAPENLDGVEVEEPAEDAAETASVEPDGAAEEPTAEAADDAGENKDA
jgi:large subunit ribosomal protein L9